MRNLENVEQEENNSTTATITRPGPGTYIGKIVAVHDCPVGFNEKKPEAGDYLKVDLDIAEGPYEHYFAEFMGRHGFWGLNTYRSYKPENVNFFKAFIKTIQKSNPGLVWDWDEHALEGCKIGMVLENETYTTMDGKERVRLKVKKIMTVDEARQVSMKPAVVVVKPKDTIEQIENDLVSIEKQWNEEDKELDKNLNSEHEEICEEDIPEFTGKQ